VDHPDDANLPHNREAAAFVASLARSLHDSKLEIPSCPDAALRLQRALSSTDIDPSVVESAAAADPALALRIMRMANSVMLNPMGREVRDLRTAIARIGYNMVRTASVSFILHQLVDAGPAPEPRARMLRLWEESLHVAAFATVMARRHTRLNPDVALLAGLLHGVGKLYILTRLAIETGLCGNETVRERLLRDWHAPTAGVIVQSWLLSEEIVDAVESSHDVRTVRQGPLTVGDVVTASRLLAEAHLGEAEQSCATVVAEHEALFRRLGIDAEGAAQVSTEAHEQLASLLAAISG